MIRSSRRVKEEWLRFELNVLKARSINNPALRAEAFEGFVGGAFGMFRIFCDEIGKIPSREEQTQAVQELHDELRSLALEAGRK